MISKYCKLGIRVILWFKFWKKILKPNPLTSNTALLEAEQDKENNGNKEFFSCLLLVG